MVYQFFLFLSPLGVGLASTDQGTKVNVANTRPKTLLQSKCFLNLCLLCRIRRRVVHRFYGIANRNIFGGPRGDAADGEPEDPEAQKQLSSINFFLICYHYIGVGIAHVSVHIVS